MPSSQPALQLVAIVKHAHSDSAARLHVGTDLRNRADSKKSSLLKYPYPITDFRELGQDMRAYKNCFSGLGEPSNHISQLDSRPRVQAGRWLVQDQYGRIVNDRPPQAQSLLHALRQAIDRFLCQRSKLCEIHHFPNRMNSIPADESISPGKEIQILDHVHVLIRSEVIRHESQSAANTIRVFDNGKPIDECVAGRRFIKRGE